MPRSTDPFGAGKGDDTRPSFITRHEKELRYALALGRHPDTNAPLSELERAYIEADLAELTMTPRTSKGTYT